MSCNLPTDIVFSFTGFALRGGKTAPHADGWGLALYQGRYARTFLEESPACQSPMAEFIRLNPIKTLLAVAHVRKKTRGRPALENTHPFDRTLWGRHWVFAHNGTLPQVKSRKLRWEIPIGDTDSEHAFCWMLEQLRAAFPAGYPKNHRHLWQAVAELGAELGAEGKLNFLLADGRYLFARCGTKLCHIVRQAPFGRATLCDADLQIDFAAVTTEKDRVAVIATEPLTRDETWEQGEIGSMWVFDKGRVVATLASQSTTATARTVARRQAKVARIS